MTASAGLFTGAGLSHAAPAAVPLAETFHRPLREVFSAAAETFAPGLLDCGAFDVVRNSPRNLLARLEDTLPGSGGGALACLRVAVPNEAHLLAAVHLAYGGVHVTVNVDDGVEQAYALLCGASGLADSAPAAYREALPSWRRCFPPRPPALRVVATPADFGSASFAERPLLVKLHGSLGRFRDGVVLTLSAAADVDVTDLGRRRHLALDVLAAEGFVVITGYSGRDFESSTALIARLRRGRFSWTAPMVGGDVRSALRSIDPGQPVTGTAVDAIRALLPVTPPAWPARPMPGPGFEERFAAWSAAVPARAAAEALAWALADSGCAHEAVVLLERLCALSDDARTRVRLADALARRAAPGDRVSSARAFLAAAERSTDPVLREYALARSAESRADGRGRFTGDAGARGGNNRMRATSSVVGALLSRIERRLAAAMTSDARRSAVGAVAEAAAADVSRVLAETADEPSGRERALLERQSVELVAIIALLARRPPPADALPSSLRLRGVYEHLSDPRGLAAAIATQALVLLAAGQVSRARRCFQEASRVDLAPTGVLATVRDLLALSRAAGASRKRRNSSGNGRPSAVDSRVRPRTSHT